MKNPLARLSLGKLLHRIKHERGAVLVEAAICIPLLLVVILGAVEAGLAWEAKSSTVSGVRTGTLRAASDAGNPAVDFRILQSVIGEVGGENADRIVSISIFEVTGNPDADFAGCLATGSGNCLVYDATDIANVVNGTLTAADFGQGTSQTDPITGELINFDCASGEIDSGWCAGERIDSGDVQIAVGIEYTHNWFTNIFPFTAPTFEEYVTSSTFTDGGVDINPGVPVATPFSTTAVVLAPFDFSSSSGALTGPNITASSHFSRRSGEEAGSFNRNHAPTITLSNQPIGSEVCVTFDYRTNNRVEGSQEVLEVRIGGDASADLITVNGAQSGTHTHCATTTTDPVDIDFQIIATADNERFFLDNLSIEVTAP